MNHDQQSKRPESEDISESALDAANEEILQEADEATADIQPDEVSTLKSQLSEMKDQYLRAVAEAENIRKRAERDQTETRKYAISKFASDMINVCENLYRALDNMAVDALDEPDNKVLKTLYMGVDMTRNELLKSFEKYGIERVAPQRGDAFDHNLHQAVSQIDDPSVPNGSVAQVIQAGYRMHDRLLQPSMVVVSKSSGEAKPSVDTTA